MHQPSLPKNANETQDTEKAPTLVVKRIREAILDEVFKPVAFKLFPTARPSEILMEIYRKGKIAEAFRAFKKAYLEIVDEVIDHLKSQEAGDSSRQVR